MRRKLDQVRDEVEKELSMNRKTELGQFMTPRTIADYMASLFLDTEHSKVKLLDAGAGFGVLTSAFLDRWLNDELSFQEIEATGIEIDPVMQGYLQKVFSLYEEYPDLETKIMNGDFIELAADSIALLSNPDMRFTHAILNPPYKKINSNSRHRKFLRTVGIETVNLYSAFVALTILLMLEEGQIVAIIPRSFCNGPYYKPFRQLVLGRCSIKHIHLFTARDKAFKNADVLQENVILHLECGTRQQMVTISQSTDDSFADYREQEYPFDRVVLPDDEEKFIHIPTTIEPNPLEISDRVIYTLSDLNIQLSTGPVVDFRLKEHLRAMPEDGCVPLIYANHFEGNRVIWPNKELKKPNALVRNNDTEKWLFPTGYYTIVKRFSSKEEKRRVVAKVISPEEFEDYEMIGFENHLNVFHHQKRGIPKNVAVGLAVFLNSSVVDDYFRRFNGHTQVNATDLKSLKYPKLEVLVELGLWAIENDVQDQEAIDTRVGMIL